MTSITRPRADMAQSVPLAQCRVMVVDDSRFNRAILRRLLDWVGVGEVLEAEDGEAALSLLRRTDADLVIADIDMPRMDGLAFCRRVREEPAWAALPLLMQTSASSDPAGVRSLDAGASDIISKPLNPGECMARIRLHLEKQFFQRDLARFHRRLQGDLQLAQAMQMSLIPDERVLRTLSERHGLELAGHFESSDELGGDFWTLFDLDAHRLGILVADFSGHGIAAAINTFRFHTLIERMPPGDTDPEAWLRRLNEPLKDLLPVGQFATCFYGVIDTRADTLTYAAAGAPGPILIRKDGVEMVDASGVMLGVSRRPVLTAATVPFGPGEALLLYSDAMTEAVDGNGRMLGEEGLLRLARQTMIGEGQLLDRLLGAFAAVAARPLADDLTAICVRRP